MDPYQSRQTDYLGVNKMGRNIRKSPIHQPAFASSNKQQPQPQSQPQPHVYNINRNDFRELVQQLTGSPLRDPPSRPPQNTHRAPNNRLQRIRPPPLAPTHRSHVPVHHYPAMAPHPVQPQLPQPQPQPIVPRPFTNQFVRPPPVQPDQLSPGIGLPPTPTDVWTNTAESPISVYMRYLQNSIISSSPRQPQSNMQAQVPLNNQQPSFPGPAMPQFPLAGAAVNGPPMALPSPRFNPPPVLPAPRVNGPPSSAPPPAMNTPPPLSASSVAPFPAPPGPNTPPFLPSPTSQFLLNSPTGFWNALSPRSPYPLLSPGYPFPPPLSPSFSFSSLGPSGVFGAPSHTPPSPGYGLSAFSPSGIFPIPSPRWRNQ